MIADDATGAARAYAEQACYQDENRPIAEAGFRAGWKAAHTHLAEQEPTGAEVEAAALVICIDMDGPDGPPETEACKACINTARRAWAAARAARRDEENR